MQAILYIPLLLQTEPPSVYLDSEGEQCGPESPITFKPLHFLLQ